MRTTIRLVAATIVALGAAGAARGVAVAEERADAALTDPLAVLEEQADDVGRPILTAFAAYDHATIRAGISALEERADTDDVHPLDSYLIAQGYAQIGTIRRFYEKHAEDDMPAALADLDPDALAESGLARATAFAAEHTDHSDIQRLIAELKSLQIRGMTSGFTKGPEALEAVAKAQRFDPQNGWAVFAQARMHYHNPAIAGGDKDLALKELRQVVKSIKHWRVYHYLSLTYLAKDMVPQAWFWARKASTAAPKNPEVALNVAAVRKLREEER